MRAAIPLALLVACGIAQAGTQVVRIEGMAFQPAHVVVKAGDRVVWENRDVVPHTVTAKGVFDSRQVAPGARWTWRAGRKGSHTYVCTLHPGMQGMVEVR